MYFGTYSWAQPPHTLRLRHTRKTELVADEAGNWSLQDFGDTGRVVEADGSFSGEHAYLYFQELVALYAAGTPKTLSLPTWGEMTALITELTLTEEPSELFLSYHIRFHECPAK